MLVKRSGSCVSAADEYVDIGAAKLLLFLYRWGRGTN